MFDTLAALAKAHDCFVASDNEFQRRARLLQAIWRDEQGLPKGEHRGKPLGSRLAMPRAKAHLENYLTDTIRAVVAREVLGSKSKAKLYGKPRIFNELLSSQPLCFNLFGELAEDLNLATRVFYALLPDKAVRVTGIEFEWSPGRNDERFTGDRSAFDVFVRYVDAARHNGFVGMEVKYHESLKDQPAKLRPRYEAVADSSGSFRNEAREQLRRKPLQQIWRDHLLAESMLLADDGWGHGQFVFLYPAGNAACGSAVSQYRYCLDKDDTFAPWTLEDLARHISAQGAGPWIDAFSDRYLRFEKLDPLVKSYTLKPGG